MADQEYSAPPITVLVEVEVLGQLVVMEQQPLAVQAVQEPHHQFPVHL
jgi:hypothetical protein